MQRAASIFYRRYFRPFGLRWGRILEWLRVLKALDRRLTAKDWQEMIRLVFRRHPVDRAGRIASNYRVCMRCPYHDRALRQCIGCGCYMPFKLAAGGGCWARETDPDSTVGFAAVPR